MENNFDDVLEKQPYPLLFVTISGAHLYGFPSGDSDYDLRGVHILPPEKVLGLHKPEETIENMSWEGALELDLVTHDAKKFFKLLLKRNGYVLEQLYSPLVVTSSPAHDRLKRIARDCITRHHGRHYLGFARHQWELTQKKKPIRVKPLLYTFRVLLTGIHLMRTGEVEANLVHLNEIYPHAFLPDLIERKQHGAEKETLPEADLDFYEEQVKKLTTVLEIAMQESTLPEAPSAFDALNDLLLDLRMRGMVKGD
jgi:uncharacterized protein